ncbi:MAG: hypothetical protein WC867_03310 [Candidatus Pacearchaeota archaeon]|jgi:hypothetical protein
MKKDSVKKFLTIGIFAIAMAFLETIIVVYLRMMYYPKGFNFPLNPNMDSNIYSLEVIREFFTIVMLVTIAILAAKKFHERFAYFMFSFAIWDIFYYIWLKVILDWPSSLFTWDILFLIPIPWLGPVAAPIICSITMIVFSFLIINFEDKGKKIKIMKSEWILLFSGGILMLYTWMKDYFNLIYKNGFLGDYFNLLTNIEFNQLVSSFIPVSYNWLIFILGEILMIIAIIRFYRREQ